MEARKRLFVRAEVPGGDRLAVREIPASGASGAGNLVLVTCAVLSLDYSVGAQGICVRWVHHSFIHSFSKDIAPLCDEQIDQVLSRIDKVLALWIL